MKVWMLFRAAENGTFERLSSVYWKDLKKGREVKRYMKAIGEELDTTQELRKQIIEEFGEDGSLGPECEQYEEGVRKYQELLDLDVELPEEQPLVDEGHLASAKGFSMFDMEVLEQLGVLKPLEE